MARTNAVLGSGKRGSGEKEGYDAIPTFKIPYLSQMPHASLQRVVRRCGTTVLLRSRAKVPWASRMGTWHTNHHPTTPEISEPFGECLVVVKASAGVGLRYLAIWQVGTPLVPNGAKIPGQTQSAARW